MFQFLHTIFLYFANRESGFTKWSFKSDQKLIGNVFVIRNYIAIKKSDRGQDENYFYEEAMII